jgi:hypothetical protein
MDYISILARAALRFAKLLELASAWLATISVATDTTAGNWTDQGWTFADRKRVMSTNHAA